MIPKAIQELEAIAKLSSVKSRPVLSVKDTLKLIDSLRVAWDALEQARLAIPHFIDEVDEQVTQKIQSNRRRLSFSKNMGQAYHELSSSQSTICQALSDINDKWKE